MILPWSEEKLAAWTVERIAECRASASERLAIARRLRSWRFSGSGDRDAAIFNKLGAHVERLGAYIFTPGDVRFITEFENSYPKEILLQGVAAGKKLSRDFKRQHIDLSMASAVVEALSYGSAVGKIMWQPGRQGTSMLSAAKGKLSWRVIMPWQFSVYNEHSNSLDEQEILCESGYITMAEFWRRISHRPDAVQLMKRARAHARRQLSVDEVDSYFRQISFSGSSPLIQTQSPYTTTPGGFVPLDAGPDPGMAPAIVDADMLEYHELYVIDEERGDYTTIQLVEPDILIAPYLRRRNLYIPGRHPYSMICPNRVEGYLWGRSELADLMRLQALLRDRMDDIKRVMSLQYDRLLAFLGFSGINDEKYDNFRNSGYISTDIPGAKVEDLTPKLPDEAFADVQMIMQFMDELSGFVPIIAGQGEQGVRAGVHAQTLLRTGSPRIRRRVMETESQASDVADKMLSTQAAKEARAYWTDESTGQERDFLLSQLPEDRMPWVDSHSASPLYEQDNMMIAALLAKGGAIDGEGLLDLSPVPGRDLFKARLREKQAAQAKLIEKYPELAFGKKPGSGSRARA